MTLTTSSALSSRTSQIVAIDLGGKLAFDAADRFLHVVGNGLREIPDHARDLLQFLIHGRDQLFLVLMKCRTPIFLWFQVDEVLGVEEAGGVGAIVRPSGLAGALRDFRASGRAGCGPDSLAGCLRWGRCWEPGCRAPTARPRPGAAGTRSR